MVAGHRAGVPPHLLFDYTHRMIAAILEAAEQNQKATMGLELWAHYQGQGLARTKRLPPFASLLRKLFPPRVMSPMAQRQSIMSMAKAMGAKVTIRKKGT